MNPVRQVPPQQPNQLSISCSQVLLLKRMGWPRNRPLCCSPWLSCWRCLLPRPSRRQRDHPGSSPCLASLDQQVPCLPRSPKNSPVCACSISERLGIEANTRVEEDAIIQGREGDLNQSSCSGNSKLCYGMLWYYKIPMMRLVKWFVISGGRNMKERTRCTRTPSSGWSCCHILSCKGAPPFPHGFCRRAHGSGRSGF